jgi:site-specific recombinase XerD
MKIALRLRTEKPLLNGECPVIIEIRNHGKRKIVSTGIHVHPDYWNDQNQQVPISVQHPNSLDLSVRIMQWQAKVPVALLHATQKGWTISEVQQFFRGNENPTDKYFFDFAFNHVKKLIKDRRVGNAKAYETAIKQFQNYVSNDKILFENVTHNLLLDFRNFKLRTNKITTVRNYLTHLRAIYNKAIDTGWITDENYPFKKLIPPAPRKMPRPILENELKLIESQNYDENNPKFHARNLYLLGFYLRGLDFIDLALLTTDKLFRDRIITNREKAKNAPEISIKIFPKAKEILDYYKGKGHKKFLLPIVKDIPSNSEQEYKRYKQKVKTINHHLKQIGKHLDIGIPLTTKTNRHTFSTIALHKGIDVEIIQEMLGHERHDVVSSYLARFPQEVIDEAHLKVIS